jgi:hypothetical protein
LHQAVFLSRDIFTEKAADALNSVVIHLTALKLASTMRIMPSSTAENHFNSINIRAAVAVGEPLAKALSGSQMAAAFGISYTTFWRKEHRGDFRAFELPRPISNKRWSGALVQEFLDAKPDVAAPAFLDGKPDIASPARRGKVAR